jgi:hypothetical protein
MADEQDPRWSEVHIAWGDDGSCASLTHVPTEITHEVNAKEQPGDREQWLKALFEKVEESNS